MNEQKVQQFTNDVTYGKSLLDLSDKKQTENKKILTLMIELNETEKMKELVKFDWRYPWEKYDYDENDYDENE